MLKFRKRRPALSRPNSPTNVENVLDGRFVSEIEKMNETINGLNRSLRIFKTMSLSSKVGSKVLKNSCAMSEGQQVSPQSSTIADRDKPKCDKSKHDRRMSEPIKSKSKTASWAALEEGQQRRNTAAYGRSVIWLANKNNNNPQFIEKNKCHPFLQRGRDHLRRQEYQLTFTEDQDSFEERLDNVESKEQLAKLSRPKEAHILMQRQSTDTPKLCKKHASKEYMMVEEEILAIGNNVDPPNSTVPKTRKLGRVELPNLQALEINGVQRKGSVCSKPLESKSQVHRNSTGRMSLRRELLERRMTIAQFNFQLQREFGEKQTKRLRKKLSFDAASIGKLHS